MTTAYLGPHQPDLAPGVAILGGLSAGSILVVVVSLRTVDSQPLGLHHNPFTIDAWVDEPAEHLAGSGTSLSGTEAHQLIYAEFTLREPEPPERIGVVIRLRGDTIETMLRRVPTGG